MNEMTGATAICPGSHKKEKMQVILVANSFILTSWGRPAASLHVGHLYDSCELTNTSTMLQFINRYRQVS